eukprot:TRINITY_DN6060_c1_g1_i1.p1 TRINITY_DN6060_c1_g1~~TRINITY_DN6060_c1_g1_i1.p1  ORF type:complete len:595 (+),score=90.42 TRINITY_DN6060_c1_g1_i1:289-2073(+)
MIENGANRSLLAWNGIQGTPSASLTPAHYAHLGQSSKAKIIEQLLGAPDPRPAPIIPTFTAHPEPSGSSDIGSGSSSDFDRQIESEPEQSATVQTQSEPALESAPTSFTRPKPAPPKAAAPTSQRLILFVFRFLMALRGPHSSVSFGQLLRQLEQLPKHSEAESMNNYRQLEQLCEAVSQELDQANRNQQKVRIVHSEAKSSIDSLVRAATTVRNSQSLLDRREYAEYETLVDQRNRAHVAAQEKLRHLGEIPAILPDEASLDDRKAEIEHIQTALNLPRDPQTFQAEGTRMRHVLNKISHYLSQGTVSLTAEIESSRRTIAESIESFSSNISAFMAAAVEILRGDKVSASSISVVSLQSESTALVKQFEILETKIASLSFQKTQSMAAAAAAALAGLAIAKQTNAELKDRQKALLQEARECDRLVPLLGMEQQMRVDALCHAIVQLKIREKEYEELSKAKSDLQHQLGTSVSSRSLREVLLSEEWLRCKDDAIKLAEWDVREARDVARRCWARIEGIKEVCPEISLLLCRHNVQVAPELKEAASPVSTSYPLHNQPAQAHDLKDIVEKLMNSTSSRTFQVREIQVQIRNSLTG